MALVEIQKNLIIFTLTEIINTITTEINEHEIYGLDLTTPKTKVKIASLIKTNHINSAEKKKIFDLCRKYSDIFHIENQPQTFTNEVKHSKSQKMKFIKS